MNKLWNLLVKMLTHNLCDTCGFTKEEVFLTKYFTEAGFFQCDKCIKNEQL